MCRCKRRVCLCVRSSLSFLPFVYPTTPDPSVDTVSITTRARPYTRVPGGDPIIAATIDPSLRTIACASPSGYVHFKRPTRFFLMDGSLRGYMAVAVIFLFLFSFFSRFVRLFV